MVRSTTLMVEMIKMVKMIRSPGCLGWWAGHWSSLSSYSLCSRPSTRRWPVCCHDENSDGDFVYKRSFLCFSHRNSYQNWSSQVSDIRKYKAKGWSLRYQYISLILLTLCQIITSVAVSESPIYALVEPIRPCTAVFWFADLQITIDPLSQSKFGLTNHNPENMMTWCFFTEAETFLDQISKGKYDNSDTFRDTKKVTTIIEIFLQMPRLVLIPNISLVWLLRPFFTLRLRLLSETKYFGAYDDTFLRTNFPLVNFKIPQPIWNSRITDVMTARRSSPLLLHCADASAQLLWPDLQTEGLLL